jgi:hypothetical protein
MTSCCDKAINNGTLVYKGRATIVCPTCGKDQMLKLVWFHDCGYEYIDGMLNTKRFFDYLERTTFND